MKRPSRLFAVALGTLLLLPALLWAERSHDSAVARNLNTFNALVKELELNYVDSIRTDESFKAAIDAFLSTIDPYTEYYNADNQETLRNITTGEYGGIGSYIMERNGSTYISGPMEGSPAAEAGLRSGDMVLRVDTTDVIGKGSNYVTSLLRGQPGTTVSVTVKRPYSTDSIRTVTIERRKLQQPSVPYYGVMNDGRTGYIRLTSFIDKSPKEVKEALDSFKEAGVKNIVLDLRGNGGGLLESAVEIVGYFVPKGTEVVRTRGKEKNSEKIYKTTHTPLYPDIPLAVLIDGASASASEITAGALQDLDRAVLVGSRSFGKGLVQSTRPLPYDGLLKVTVAKYYIPSGRLIQALDYSHRNSDGSVARTPDSLTNVFKTLHGREIRDGGGLVPDDTVNWGNSSRIVYNVVRDYWAFDFATKYAAEHESISSPAEFEITDEIYDDFKRSIDPQKFKYDKVCEEMLRQLEETATSEGYMNDETKAEFETMKRLLTHNLDHDLDTHREDISGFLGDEIVGRYYYDRGKLIFDLKSDKGLAKAISILDNPEEYGRLLSPRKEK